MSTLLALGLTLAVFAMITGSGSAQDKPATLLAAHRGGAALWPENSLLAFGAPTWRRVRELRPDIATCALYSARSLAGISLSAELGMLRAAAVPFVGIEHTVVDAATVAEARKAGIGVGAWTVNDAVEM